MGQFEGRRSPVIPLIAMQKVVGSNPISRFFAIALHLGGLGSAQVAETRWNHFGRSRLAFAWQRSYVRADISKVPPAALMVAQLAPFASSS